MSAKFLRCDKLLFACFLVGSFFANVCEVSAQDQNSGTTLQPSKAVAASDSPVVLANATQVPDEAGLAGVASQEYQTAPGSEIPGSGYQAGDYLYSRTDRAATRRYNTLVENYNVPAIGPRAYANYSPSLYYGTDSDYQTTPGQPLYLRLSPPVSPTEEDDGRFVLRGPVPGSYLVPGTSTAFRFSGFVRMGANYNFDQIRTPDLFVTNAIPVPQDPDLPNQNVNFSARPTRLSLDTWTPTSMDDLAVHTFIQFDFLSDNPPAGGSAARPRLRLAFIDLGYFRIGQDTTVFMDPSSFPRTADFQGPNGVVNSRQGLCRMTLPLTERVFFASAVEQPFSDITTNATGINIQDSPDFTNHLRFESDLLRFQTATILRSIGYRATGQSVDRELGWGVNITSNFHPWAACFGTNPLRDADPGPLTRSRVILQYATGSGIGRYFQDSSGQGLDGAIDASGQFRALDISGWTTAYEQWLSKKWLANFVCSGLKASGTNAMAANTFNNSTYVAAGLWWIPVGNASIGAEYLWGERENLDGQSRAADRLQTAFVYSF
ncbi:MAG: DcaP family trimeric outer membrane transporter [Planctomycetota bacterium]|nr:DcaP family trimeric outer membrane transporter [Planctomycetota bacterium]